MVGLRRLACLLAAIFLLVVSAQAAPDLGATEYNHNPDAARAYENPACLLHTALEDLDTGLTGAGTWAGVWPRNTAQVRGAYEWLGFIKPEQEQVWVDVQANECIVAEAIAYCVLEKRHVHYDEAYDSCVTDALAAPAVHGLSGAVLTEPSYAELPFDVSAATAPLESYHFKLHGGLPLYLAKWPSINNPEIHNGP